MRLIEGEQRVHDELIDLVDSQDRVIGKTWRSTANLQGLRNIRMVNGFIMNRKGELWIPTRTVNKTLYPSALDFSVGGGVKSGEWYDEAFERERAEELGITGIPYQFVTYLNPDIAPIFCHTQLFLMRSDTVPNYNQEDFSGYRWMKPHDLEAELMKGVPAKSDLLPMLYYI